MKKLPWKPWHEVVALRDDLKSGDLSLNLFAADLYEVLMQSGKRPVYENAEDFFALTYPTHNLRALVRDVALRIAGKNDKAVRQLELTYGGGKTHTLITLRHLHHDPSNLPNVPSVAEFKEEIGETPTRAKVVGLCFDKIDVETAIEARGPDGEERKLLQPWSFLAYQLLGDEGLKILHKDGKAEERVSPPSELLITKLLDAATANGDGVLVLLDEVIAYARQKVNLDPKWEGIMEDFFQFLTQAAGKTNRCCIVAAILASDVKYQDAVGNRLRDKFYAIFQRQREEAIEPVEKRDVAEVLRRRFFKPESIRDVSRFKPHVIAALKGVIEADDETRRNQADAEERYLRSYPFDPELTDAFYSKWTQINGFQKARGVLRVFALAIREAARWDTSPLIGAGAFLREPEEEGLSAAAHELVTIADGQDPEGKRAIWTAILTSELGQAKKIQNDSIGLNSREIEVAAFATFLHSQPTGRSARLRDLILLLAPSRPDKIELEKGLKRWARMSFWLDDRHTANADEKLPETWALGNRPNLNQMHAKAAAEIDGDVVKARLLGEIGKAKDLMRGASASGVRVHTLPQKPKDVEDDGDFHYAILGPEATSESGKPSAEATRFLNETTSAEKPRVYRNAIILLTPTRDGVELARNAIRDYLAWEQVRTDLKDESDEGQVDVARMQTLAIRVKEAQGKISSAIYQAYSTVVTINEKNEPHAFKLSISDEPHFQIIKNEPRSRIKDTAINADSLVPGGPYDLWNEGQTTRRVKDLTGAFAQLPRLPKMLKAETILETLVEGCRNGAFVLELRRPDGSERTWWFSSPDDTALKDPALELVLPERAELVEIDPSLIAKDKLPDLWKEAEIKVQNVYDYFKGEYMVQVKKGEYEEPLRIPRAEHEVVDKAIKTAVEKDHVWLINGPTSICGEEVAPGILNAKATLLPPPEPINVTDILPEVLPEAWAEGKASASAIATSLSQKAGKTLPWKTVKTVITQSINNRYLKLTDKSAEWPCDFSGAGKVTLEETGQETKKDDSVEEGGSDYFASVVVSLDEAQDLLETLANETVPTLLEIKAKSGVAMKIRVRVERDAESEELTPEDAEEIQTALKNTTDKFEMKH